MTDLDVHNEAAVQAWLEAHRDELKALSAVSDEQRRPVELDQASVGRLSRMDALQGQAMAQAVERRRHDEIARVEAALARLAEGEYGACVSCGEDISEERLRLDPATPLCLDCAKGG